MGIFIDSYADCVEAFRTVRNPVLGKPINGRGLRLYKNRDESFRLTLNERTFAYVGKDDTITFVLDRETMYNTVAASLVYSMHRFLPLALFRVGSGRYRIGKLSGYKQRKELPEYFGGIQFKLTDSQCLNPRPDRNKRLNKENHAAWKKALKEYRKGLFARLKLGVRGSRQASDDHQFTIVELGRWIKDGEYPDTLLNHMAWMCRANADYTELTQCFENIIANNRDGLRKLFGVFDDEA